jgi:hypothetical protein
MGLGFYLMVDNTTLSLRAGTCCFWAVLVATFIVRRNQDGRDGIWPVWSSSVAMLLLLMELAIAYGQDRHWPPGVIHALSTVADWVLSPAIVCVVAVALIMMWPAARRQLMRLIGRG